METEPNVAEFFEEFGPEFLKIPDTVEDFGALDAALLAAHADRNLPALVGLYAAAAGCARREDRPDAAGFFLTQAYIFALDAGDPRAAALHAALRADRREE